MKILLNLHLDDFFLNNNMWKNIFFKFVVYSQDKKYNLQKKSLIKFAKNLAKMILMHKKLI
jgi:hypothetical protein